MSRVRLANRFTVLLIALVCFSTWIPLSVNIGGLNLRASQLMLPIVLGWFMISPQRFRPQISILLVCGVTFWSFTIAWTLIDIESSASLGRVFLLALNMLHALAIYDLMMRSRDRTFAVFWLIRMVTVFNLFIILAAVAGGLGITVFPGLFEQEAAPVFTAGEMSGATVMRFIFGGVNGGVISACVILLCLALLMYPKPPNPGSLFRHCLVSTMGMVVSFSRQAVVSLALGLVVLLIYSMFRIKMKMVVRGTAVVLVMGLGMLFIDNVPGGHQLFGAFAGRAYQLIDRDSYSAGTAGEREKIWTAMMEDIKAHPFVGLGQDSYIRYAKIGTAGSHNFPLEVLHSSGLFGFLAYLVMHLVIIFRAINGMVKRADFLLAGVFAAFLAVLSSSFTNLIAMSPFYWVLIGMVAAVARLRATPVQSPVPPIMQKTRVPRYDAHWAGNPQIGKSHI